MAPRSRCGALPLDASSVDNCYMGLSAFNNIDMLFLSFLSSIFTYALLCMPSWADAH